MATYKYDQMIPWFKLREYLENRLKASDTRLRRAVVIEEVYHTQGQSLLLEELLNLPNTLTMLDVTQDQPKLKGTLGMYTQEELKEIAERGQRFVKEVLHGKEEEPKDS